jgi:uncharacterized protein (TIGR03435 family)
MRCWGFPRGLAERLWEMGAVDLPVVDNTNLKGTFDVSMKFPDGVARASSQPGGYEVSIFSALEAQLGLKLELRKGSSDVVVIDSALKAPIDN